MSHFPDADPAAELEAALLPLFVYCERAMNRDDVSDWTLAHVQQLEAVFAAVAAYDQAVKVELSAQARAMTQERRRFNPFDVPRSPATRRPLAPDGWPGHVCPPGLDAASLLRNIPKMACFQNGLARLATLPNG